MRVWRGSWVFLGADAPHATKRLAKVLTTKHLGKGGGQGAKKPRDLGAGPEDAGV